MVCQGHQRRRLFSRSGLPQKSPSPIPIPDLEINEAPEIPVENDLSEDVVESSIEPSPESPELEAADITLEVAEISGEEAGWDPLATEEIEVEEVLEDLTTDSSSLNSEQPAANSQEEETSEETTEITTETSSEVEPSLEVISEETESIDPVAESELEEDAIDPVTENESEPEEDAIVAETDETDADIESTEVTDEDLEEEDEDAEDTLVDIPLLLSDVVGGLGTVTDPSGQLSVIWKFDGGAYEGQVGVVSTAGLENYDLNSIEFMQEALRRALDNIVVDDTIEGSEISGNMGDGDSNHGEFAGEKIVQLSVGEQFFFVVIPNGTFTNVLASLEAGELPTGSLRPLFSLTVANPDSMNHFVQVVDLTGKGSTFALEDISNDQKSDWDLNDIIITVKGADLDAPTVGDLIDAGVITEAPKWMETDLGGEVIDTPNLENDEIIIPPEIIGTLPVDPLTGAEYIPGSMMLKFDSTATEAEILAFAQSQGAISVENLFEQETNGDGQWKVLQFAPDQDLVEVRAVASQESIVAGVELDYKLTANISRDSMTNSLWGLNNTGQTGGLPDADIDLPEAWRTQTGSKAITVAVIDTGGDYRHPDLAANTWRNQGEVFGNGVDDDRNGFVDDVHGYDFVNRDGDPMDDQGHGTHVAGTIGAVGNNNRGVVGVNQNVSLMHLKFLDSQGSGSTINAIRSVDYATRMGADVINASFGGGGYSQAMFDALSRANNAGVLFVAAAGNEGNNNDFRPSFPANYDLPNVISVAATDHRDRLAGFSNFGRNSVDIGAPGVNILSTLPGNRYGSFSGTSMAAPHVAGAAALLLAENSNQTPSQLKNLLMRTADPVTSLQGSTVTGGRLNVNRALSQVTPQRPIWEVAIDEAYARSPVNLGRPLHGYLDATNSPQGTTGKCRAYEYGTIHWTPQHGAVPIWLDLQREYSEYGSPNGSGGWLGFPTKIEYPWNGGMRTDFEGGYIFWNGQRAKAYPTSESIRDRNLRLFPGLQFSTVISKATNKALDAGGSNDSVYQHPSPNFNNEFHQWGFEKVGEDYMIINKATGKALDGGRSNGTLPYVNPDPNRQNPWQLWKLTQVGDSYMIVNKATGRALDSGGNTYMHSTPMTHNPHHLWKLNLQSLSSFDPSATHGSLGDDFIATSNSTIRVVPRFNGWVMSTVGANVRSGPSTTFSRVGFRNHRDTVTFDAWTYGQRINDVQLGTPDERWYRIAGTTNQWIASALIFGNAPGSTPLPVTQPITSPVNWNSPAYRQNNPLWNAGFAPKSVNPPRYSMSNPNAKGNCTWYANGRLRELGYSSLDLNRLVGNAADWDNQAQAAGIPMSRTPKVGSIAQWDSNHVAVVEQVNSDGTIVISESSYWPTSPHQNDYLYNRRTISAANPSRYIHVRR